MAKVRVLIILTAVAFLLLPGIASSDGPLSCQFAGVVKLDGADVADGTTITATIAGNEYTTTTPTGYGTSTYAITIQPPEGTYYADGTPVRFKINGHAAYQTGTFQAGENIRLDLTASTRTTPARTPAPPTTPTPISSPTTTPAPTPAPPTTPTPTTSPTMPPAPTPTPATSPTAPTPTPNPSPGPEPPTNVWLIVGLVIACIAEVSVVGGVAYIVFSNWSR